MKRSLVGGFAILVLSLAALPLDAIARNAPHRPLSFEVNRGQTDPEVAFLGRGAGYSFFLTATGAVLELRRSQRERAVVRMSLVGANPAPAIAGEGQLPGAASYYRRGESPRHIANVPTYARVRYAAVYPGVDLVYHSAEGRLEYDFIVAPGADPRLIALAFEGADRLVVDDRGDLVLHTAAGELRQPRPVIYQDVEGVRRTIAGGYVLSAPGRVDFRLGDYDASRPLVIDPLLDFSTYLGGSGEESDSLYGDLGVGAVRVAVDAAGNAYVTGTTTSGDFPTTPGRDRVLDGNRDAFVTKLSPTGAVLYSTYLGGPCEDIGLGIAVDGSGNAYVTGRAHDRCSLNVPTGVLVAKLSPTGSVLYFITLGTSLGDSSVGLAIAADDGGNAYVAGSVQGSRDFPTTPGAFRTTDCGTLPEAVGPDGFVAKVNPQGTALVYSTYLCGTAQDSVTAIAVDSTGHAYVTGSTISRDFPTRNAYQESHAGWGVLASSAFVAKLLPDESDLVYSTYLGGASDTVGAGIALDSQGHAYVTGTTIADDFPTTAGVLQPVSGTLGCIGPLCVSDAFVAKLGPTGSDLIYSTYLFGEGADEGMGIAVDAAGHAYVAGSTASLYFPVRDAFQATKSGLTDAFVAKLNPDATALVYSSYLGGGRRPTSSATTEGWDAGLGIALHAATGAVYVAGYTNSFSFPTTPAAFQPNPGGGVCFVDDTPCGDAFVSRITAGGPGIVPPRHLTVTPAGVAPGGTITATWAGLPAPSPNDELRLYTLGSAAGGYTAIASWPTTGAANGTVQLVLPDALVPGISLYELRVWSADPDFWNLPGVMARSEPIRVGVVAASADLVVTGIATTPAQPTAGQAVTVVVTVANQGTAAAGAFAVDVYKHRTAAPTPGAPGDAQCSVAGLAPGAAVACTRGVTYTAAGSFSLWAQVDGGQAVIEADEGNNVSGPRAMTVAAAPPGLADLVVSAVSDPPATALPGARFSVTDTVVNQGTGSAAASRTRYYFSLDGTRTTGDALLAKDRAVAALAAAAQSTGTVLVTVPVAIPYATYRLLACADDTALVAEASDANNCRAAAGSIVVGRPDLVITAVSAPPAAARPGASFIVADTARNDSPAATDRASTIRYYLSLDAARGTGDRLLTGSRTVPILAGAAQSAGPATALTIPTTTPLGTYFLLACADDTDVIAEGNETNNCRASATRVIVAAPDLSIAAITNPAGPFPRGARFTLSDTVRNGAAVDTGAPSTTRYYLSRNGTKDATDRLLTGSRALPILEPDTERAGVVTVTIPTATAAGTYVLLACADDLRTVSEASETNNCRASTTAIAVTP